VNNKYTRSLNSLGTKEVKSFVSSRRVIVLTAGLIVAMQPFDGKQLLFILADSNSPTAANSRVVLDEASPRADVAPGDRIEIRLKAALGAGFSWSLETPTSDSAVKYLDTTIEPSGFSRPGVGGQQSTQVFLFEAVHLGVSALKFIYYRPWLKPTESDKRVLFTVAVHRR
jgi:predicted secreted protein